MVGCLRGDPVAAYTRAEARMNAIVVIAHRGPSTSRSACAPSRLAEKYASGWLPSKWMDRQRISSWKNAARSSESPTLW